MIAVAKARSKAIYEVLRLISERLEKLGGKIDDVRDDLQILRTDRMSMQQDIHDIYTNLVRHEGRLGRIERRIEISESPLLP